MTTEIQWYIARDGKQYGPLSDPEMGLFVKGGHLKPADLVWRPGFNDWLPATAAFPALSAPPPSPPQAPQSPHPSAGQAPAQPQFHTQGASQAPAPSTAHAQAAQTRTQTGPASQPAAAPGQPRLSEMARPRPTEAAQPRPAAASAPLSPASPHGASQSAVEQPGQYPAQSTGGRAVIAIEPGFPDDEADHGKRRGPRLGRLAAIAATLLVLAGGGWLTYQKRDSVKAFVTAMVAGKTGGGGKIDPSAPAFVVEAGPADAIDARLQKTALWSVVKREFPEWYGERLTETAKLTAEKKPDAAVTKHLLEALVGLRRKHSNDALAASSSRLISIADAFLANLKKISTHSTTTCYSFISQGEASPAMIEMLQKNASDTDLQAQVTAIFEAIAEGRKSPTKHATPDKTDYDALAEQLTKLGWSQADLQLFADPRALARTSHDRVCKMVQDWFSAHIAVKDRAAQERLLIETLRPVVAG